jgi:hypothetical protein
VNASLSLSFCASASLRLCVKILRPKVSRTKGPMATKEIDAAAESFEAAVMRLLRSLPPEKLPAFLQALAPDPAQRLAGLGAQQILEGLSPEVRAALEEKLRH